MFDVVRTLRAHGDAAVQALIGSELIDRVVEADEHGQVVILTATLRRLQTDPVLAEQAPDVHRRIREILEQTGSLRSRDEALALAYFLQGQVDAVGPLAWRRELVEHLARLHSDGPAARRGGDLGLLEPGRLTEAQRAAVAPLPEGGVSRPFWVGQACALLFVDEVIPPAVPSLDQVSAEMEGLLRHEQRQAVRDHTLAELRRRARIRFPD
ncbi:MAG: peptidylprolyl isomerase [Planctomycetota bacterium]